MKVVEYKGEKVEAGAIAAGQAIELNAPKQLMLVASVFQGLNSSLEVRVVGHVWNKDKKEFELRPITLPKKDPVKILTGSMVKTLAERLVARASKLDIYTAVRASQVSTGYSSGSDPEIFVVDGKNNPLPAWKFLKGKKATHGILNPYHDGAAAEFTVGVGSCLDGLTSSVRSGLLATLDAALIKDNKAKLVPYAIMEFGSDELRTWDKEIRQFGCAPSLNAYNLSAALPDDHADIPFRSAGCHVHLGSEALKSKLPGNAVQAVKMIDATLGVASVSAFEGLEDPRRRELYGLPGEYRQPAHGLEYRVFSSAMLCHPGIFQLFWDMTRVASTMGLAGLRPMIEATDDEVIDIIRATDVKAARAYLKKYRDVFQRMLSYKYQYGDSASIQDSGMLVFENGVSAIVKDPVDMYINWQMAAGGYPGGMRWSELAGRFARNSKKPTT